jgi:hypothetical protein
MNRKPYIILAALLLTLAASGQTQEATIKRSVTLYNPYKPTLQDATKRALLPAADDTSKVRIDFTYDFVPGTFVPEYKISPIKAASLSPDPLPELQKGYVNLGFGTYLTPFLEVSLTNDRSKDHTIGLFTRSYLSGGRMTLENDDIVYTGFMDNQALLYGKKYYKRSRLDSDIDFRQMSRYAYGYDTDITGWEPERDEIRSVYYDLTGRVRYFTMEPDSSDLNWDATLKYNLFSRAGDGTQHNPGLSVRGGKNMFGFYGGADVDYDLWIFSESLDTKARNLFSLAPYVTKGTEEWRFRFGIKIVADIKEDYDPLSGGDIKPYMYFYPDVLFTFRIIPEFLRFNASIDGSLDNNQAKTTVYVNPYLMPGSTLFTLRNTDNKLRVAAGIAGNVNVSATYAFNVSYTLSDDILLFMNDTLGVGNYFVPVYDDGDMLRVHGEMSYPFNSKLSFALDGNYYRYSLTGQEYAWHRPDWDGTFRADYNLRNKIVASAALTLIGQRHALVKAPEKVVKLEMHPNLNLGAEYRYTRVMSFWVRANNLSYKKYYEWNYYPAHNFMILAGFTYSL